MKVFGLALFDSVQRVLKHAVQFAWGDAANESSENRVGTVSQHHFDLAHANRFEVLAFGAADRIVNEILDCCEHTRNHFGIFCLGCVGRRCNHVLEQQTGLAMNQKYLFDAVEQAVGAVPAKEAP